MVFHFLKRGRGGSSKLQESTSRDFLVQSSDGSGCDSRLSLSSNSERIAVNTIKKTKNPKKGSNSSRDSCCSTKKKKSTTKNKKKLEDVPTTLEEKAVSRRSSLSSGGTTMEDDMHSVGLDASLKNRKRTGKSGRGRKSQSMAAPALSTATNKDNHSNSQCNSNTSNDLTVALTSPPDDHLKVSKSKVGSNPTHSMSSSITKATMFHDGAVLPKNCWNDVDESQPLSVVSDQDSSNNKLTITLKMKNTTAAAPSSKKTSRRSSMPSVATSTKATCSDEAILTNFMSLLSQPAAAPSSKKTSRRSSMPSVASTKATCSDEAILTNFINVLSQPARLPSSASSSTCNSRETSAVFSRRASMGQYQNAAVLSRRASMGQYHQNAAVLSRRASMGPSRNTAMRYPGLLRSQAMHEKLSKTDEEDSTANITSSSVEDLLPNKGDSSRTLLPLSSTHSSQQRRSALSRRSSIGPGSYRYAPACDPANNAEKSNSVNKTQLPMSWHGPVSENEEDPPQTNVRRTRDSSVTSRKSKKYLYRQQIKMQRRSSMPSSSLATRGADSTSGMRAAADLLPKRWEDSSDEEGDLPPTYFLSMRQDSPRQIIPEKDDHEIDELKDAVKRIFERRASLLQ